MMIDIVTTSIIHLGNCCYLLPEKNDGTIMRVGREGVKEKLS